MCGICGIYLDRPVDSPVLAQATARMNTALTHRGPDDEGAWVDPAGRVALGNRRLAIIDLSAAGHQPMADSSGRVVLTYNGEIYNFPELRQELEASGYPFHGHSDTEVILALYLRDGTDMVRRLRGMFALILWDGRSGRLMLARDRLGIKPLYYAHHDAGWVVASEIRAIKASGLVPTAVNPVALAAFLRLGSVPGPLSVLDGVMEVPPASTLTFDAAAEIAIPRRYWEIPAPERTVGQATAAPREIRDRLRDAVARHLISDVPLGVFLSGGVDSSAIVAMMREAGHARIRTFAITFAEPEFDEGAEAARLAAWYETEHTAWQVQGEDVVRDLDDIIAAMDQPTIDGINTYYVSRATRRSGSIVALSGLGGDELFCGYPSFHQAPRVRKWQQALMRLGPARYAAESVLAVAQFSGSARLRESLRERPTISSAYAVVRGLLSREELGHLLRPGPLRDAVEELDAAAALAALAPPLPEDPVAATGVLELRGYMHNQLLRDTDTMSMAHSLEVRVPFLDHPLVEFAAGLPGSVRANGHPPKWLLLEALKDRLPPGAGGAKRGFTFPLGSWLRGPLRPRVDEVLRDAEPFDATAVSRLWAAVQAGRVHWSRIWAVVVLVLWLGRFSRSSRPDAVGTTLRFSPGRPVG